MQSAFIQHALNLPAGADTGAVAEASARALVALFNQLDPLVGARGTQALCVRCLHLTRPLSDWPAAADGDTRGDLLGSIRSHLLRMTPAAARQASTALLAALTDLLVSLIGPAVTLRLLRSAWGDPAAAGPPLEMSK